MTQDRKAGLVFSHRYLQHNTNPFRLPSGAALPFVEQVDHPSNPRLVDRTMHLVDVGDLSKHLVAVDPYMAAEDAILACHTPELLGRVKAADAAGSGDAGRGAPVGRGSYDIARLAAGGVMAAVDAVMSAAPKRVYALVRPPGHHAIADQGLGFCIFNNVAIAARHAQQKYGIERVMILDWDVHDGNGTQSIFYDDPNVLFFSFHQNELYPAGWGLIDQVGDGDGVGRTVNVPLPAGSGNAAYLAAMQEIVLPIARQFAPQLIIVSAGQDASASDPLGRMSVTTAGYRAMTQVMIDLAEECCEGRIVAAQEGGYSENYAPYCTLAIIETFAEERTGLEEPIAEDRPPTWPQSTTVGLDARATLDAVKQRHAEFWELD